MTRETAALPCSCVSENGTQCLHMERQRHKHDLMQMSPQASNTYCFVFMRDLHTNSAHTALLDHVMEFCKTAHATLT